MPRRTPTMQEDNPSNRPLGASQHAVLPAQAPPPFPEPILLTARRIPGLVLTPPHEANVGDADGGSCSAAGEDSYRHASRPTTLERRASVAGNILLVQVDAHTTKAFMLQRKIKTTVFGSVRVGYVLKDPPSTTGDDHPGAWEVAIVPEDNASSRTQLVAVTIEDKSMVLTPQRRTVQDPRTELSALQWVASRDLNGTGHVVGTPWVAADDAFVYTIVPYHKEGSLFDHCVSTGTLSEPDARYFFKQILKGLETLQADGLCHRDLNLQNVVLRGSWCSIRGLGCALRIPTDPDTGIPHLIEPQPPCASNPQTVAPEMLHGNEPFDGYAVDLWAAGVMLLTMLFGTEALFAAPVGEDPKFQALCRGDWRKWADHLKNGSRHPPEGTSMTAVSDAALDLLQRMLRADPRERLTLAQVMQHPWVVQADGDGPESVPNVPRRPIRFQSD